MLMNRVLHTAHARGGSNTASNLYVLTYVHFYDIKTSKKKKAKRYISRTGSMWAFDFPKLSLLMASRQHETWHVIHYSVHVPCYLRLLHMAPVVSRHPNPFPQARGCFCGNHYTAPLPQRNGVTMMSAHSHSRLSASILTTYSTIDRIRWPNC